MISGNGRFVFFQSWDIDFGDGEFLPFDSNIFRWDRLTGQTALVTPNKYGTGGASGSESYFMPTSYDGNTVAFTSDSPDLVFGDFNNYYDVFVWQAGALPALSISRLNNTVRIIWPIDSPAGLLETRTPSSAWSTVDGPIQQDSGNYLYQAPIGNEPVRFFRLRVL